IARHRLLGTHDSYVYEVLFHPHENLVVSSDHQGTIVFTDVVTRKPVGLSLRHAGAVFKMAINASGSLLVVGTVDGSIHFWDPRTRQRLGDPVKAHEGPVTSLDMNPLGTRLATASEDHYQGRVMIWDVLERRALGLQDQVHPTSAVAVR